MLVGTRARHRLGGVYGPDGKMQSPMGNRTRRCRRMSTNAGYKEKSDGVYEECGPVKSNQLAVAVALVLRVGKVLADEK